MELKQSPPRGAILLPALGAVLLLAGVLWFALRVLDPSSGTGRSEDPEATGVSSSDSAGDLSPDGATASLGSNPESGMETGAGGDALSDPGTTDSSLRSAPTSTVTGTSSYLASPVISGDNGSISSSGGNPLPPGWSSSSVLTLDDRAALRELDALEEEARISEAARGYASLAADSARSPELRAQAAQSAARIAWARADVSATLSALALAPPAESAPEAHYLRAEALAAAGRSDEAIAAYEAYADARPAMADVALLSAGALHAADDRYTEAAAAYERAFADAASPSTAALAAVREGNAWLDAQDTSAALDAYRRAESVAPSESERAQALAGQVAAHLAADDETAALAARRRLVVELPRSDPARVALTRLLELGEDVGPDTHATVLRMHGEYSAALAILERALADAASAAPPPATANEDIGTRTLEAIELELELGRAAAARARADTFLASGQDSPVEAAIAFARTRALRAEGRGDEEIEALAAIATTYPYAPGGFAYDALWRRALLVEQRDGDIAGGAAWAAVFDLDPSESRSGDAGFRAGWLAYVGGRRDTAITRWEDLVARSEDAIADARGHYWLGRLAADAGDETAATAHWRSAVPADPNGWYGLRAAQRLSTAPPGPGPDAPATADDPAATIGAWLATIHPIIGPGAVTDAIPHILAHRDVQRAEAYLALGRRRDALRGLRGTESVSGQDAGTRAARNVALSLVARELGLDDIALGHATAALRMAPFGAQAAAPVALWSLAYPDPWPDLTRAAAGSAEIETALLLALLRQESRFEPTAISSAGARGLAQVMPGTGDGIASQLRASPYSTDDLYRPSVALRFGAYYIGQQLQRFDGQPGPALAAYNGGPGNAARWWPESLGDTDRLVETIDFRETRSYLRLVLVNYEIYRAIQASGS